MSCRSGCTAGGHRSWGECARAADIQIDRHGLQHSGLEKDKEKRLNRYADARSQGLQPKNTEWKSVRDAFESGGTAPSEVTGV